MYPYIIVSAIVQAASAVGCADIPRRLRLGWGAGGWEGATGGLRVGAGAGVGVGEIEKCLLRRSQTP